jgi:GAF domain-containing protein
MGQVPPRVDGPQERQCAALPGEIRGEHLAGSVRKPQDGDVSAVPSVDLAEVARLAEGDVDPSTTLRRIVEYATTLVPGCTGAGLTVLTEEDHDTAALTDHRVERCHAAQFAPQGRGPAREALRYREPRRSDDLARESRWPEFVDVARRCGFRSTLALPLPSDRHGASALALYADEPGAFAGTTFDVALLFAAEGGVALDNAELYRRSQEMVTHLHRTLATRSVIERAKGVLMHQQHVSSEEAFELLRHESQVGHRKLRDVALALLEQQDPTTTATPTPWTPPRRPTRPADRS